MATKKGGLRVTSRRAYTGLKKSPSYRKLEAQKMALQRRYTKAKALNKVNTTAATAAVCTASGGAAAGAVNAYLSPVFGVPVPALVGLGCVIFGAMGSKSSKLHSGLACLGGGMLAKVAGDYTEDFLAGAPAAGAAVAGV
jgi:hypothetical protein